MGNALYNKRFTNLINEYEHNVSYHNWIAESIHKSDNTILKRKCRIYQEIPHRFIVHFIEDMPNHSYVTHHLGTNDNKLKGILCPIRFRKIKGLNYKSFDSFTNSYLFNYWKSIHYFSAVICNLKDEINKLKHKISSKYKQYLCRVIFINELTELTINYLIEEPKMNQGSFNLL